MYSIIRVEEAIDKNDFNRCEILNTGISLLNCIKLEDRYSLHDFLESCRLTHRVNSYPPDYQLVQREKTHNIHYEIEVDTKQEIIHQLVNSTYLLPSLMIDIFWDEYWKDDEYPVYKSNISASSFHTYKICNDINKLNVIDFLCTK
jgi:hypothetical protein